MGFFDWFKRKRKPHRKMYEDYWHPLGFRGGTVDDPKPLALVSAFEDIVYSCIMLIAHKLSSIPINLYVKTATGQAKPKCETRKISTKTYERLAITKNLASSTRVEQVVEHPLLGLLNSANAYHNRQEWLALNIIYLELTGNALNLMAKDVFELPSELYLLPSHMVQPQREGVTNHIVAWKYEPWDDPISVDRVIHFKHPNPLDPYGWGYAPLQAAWKRFQIALKETGYHNSVLDNQAKPEAMLSPKEEVGEFEAERLAKQYIERFRAGGAGGVFVPTGPMDLTPIGWSPKDLAELELFQVVRQSVCNAFGVPIDIFNPGQANRSSAESALYILSEQCLKPRMCLLLNKLNERLVPLFDDRLFFESEPVVPEDKTYELEQSKFLASTGSVTHNELRVRNGLEPVEWGNEQVLAPGQMPAIPDGAGGELDIETVIDRSNQSPVIQALQQAVYSGALVREAAIANVMITLGLTRQEAEALFPDVPPPAPPEKEPEAPPEPQTQKVVKSVAVPDIRQQGDYDCGAAATMAVCQAFQVGPETEAEYVTALGTTEEDGTTPENIVRYLQEVGLEVRAQNDLSIGDLMQATAQNKLVIVCIQDYEDKPEDIPEETSGHYVVVTAADDDKIAIQDPSGGPLELNTYDFLARWEDRDSGGEYVHYGIVVGAKTSKALTIKALRPKSPLRLAEALQRFFRKQEKALVHKLTTKALPHDWINIDQWTEEMKAELMPIVALYYDDAAKKTVAQLGGSKDLFNVVQPGLREALQKHVFHFCAETNQTTALELTTAHDTLKKELEEGLVTGDYQNALAERVRGVFEQAGINRSYTIAHTEASRAQHSAMEITAVKSGVATGKKWLLSDDACDKCLPLSGKTVALGESFETVGGGPYGAITAPPRHPMCRCTMTLVTDAEETE